MTEGITQIKNLEELFIGNKLEKVVSEELKGFGDKKLNKMTIYNIQRDIITAIGKVNSEKIIYFYQLIGNKLISTGGYSISEKQYNNHLNSIKKEK